MLSFPFSFRFHVYSVPNLFPVNLVLNLCIALLCSVLAGPFHSEFRCSLGSSNLPLACTAGLCFGADLLASGCPTLTPTGCANGIFKACSMRSCHGTVRTSNQLALKNEKPIFPDAGRSTKCHRPRGALRLVEGSPRRYRYRRAENRCSTIANKEIPVLGTPVYPEEGERLLPSRNPGCAERLGRRT